MEKLVRDGVPDFLESQGTHLEFDTGIEEERFDLLWDKLIEEAMELNRAIGPENVLKELADLQEVIWALAEACEIDPTAVVTQAAIKQRTRGKFNNLRIMKIELGPEPLKPFQYSKTKSEPREIHWDMKGRKPGEGCYSG